MPPLRIIFFGTAELAVPSLIRLVDGMRCVVEAVVTQPDRPKGRDLKVQPSPVKAEALLRDLRILQPERCRNAEFLSTLCGIKTDLIVVAAYGQILPTAILDLPTHGCLNVHTSLLPKYRGAAPIQWAILNGDSESGVTIMRMDAGMDTGDILTQQTTPIHDTDTAQTLHDRLADIGADLLEKTISGVLEGSISARKQSEHDASYVRKILKADGKLDWTKPAIEVWNRVRALTPWPGTFTHLMTANKPKLLKIGQVEIADSHSGEPGTILRSSNGEIVIACGESAVRVLSLQLEGGRRMTCQQFLAGHSLPQGSKLG